MSLGSCGEVDILLSTCSGRDRLAALRLTTWLSPRSPRLGCVPESTAPPAGGFSQKLPAGSQYPTFLCCDPPPQEGSGTLEADFE